MERRSRKRSSSAGSKKMERELVIDREKWGGIVRQTKAHSGLQHQRKKKKWESEVQKRPGPALPDDG